MEKQAKASSSCQMGATGDNDIQKYGKFTTYYQSVSYPIQTLSTDHSIAEAETDIMNFKWPGNMPVFVYCETLL